MAARGLIVKPLEDGTFEPVALPFPKFENWGKEIADIHEGERGPVVSVTAKMDGSLGIIFWDDVQGRWRVSTRGSFAEKSTQAAWAEKILAEHHGSFAEADKAYTYLVEIICEESIVVVPYKTEDHGLILLSAYHVASGLELRRPHLEAHGARLSMKVVAESPLGDVKEILETTKTLNGLEQEGWVVRFANGERRKFKGEDYKRLHRLHSGFNPMALWVNLSSAEDPSGAFHRLLLVLPDEFHDEAKALAEPWIERAEKSMGELEEGLKRILEGVETGQERRAIGMGMKDSTLPPYAMASHLGKTDQVRAGIWRGMKP